MAAAAPAKQQDSRIKKGRKNHKRSSFFCFSAWGCCGGVSSRVADRGDGKLVKHGGDSLSVEGKKEMGIVIDSMLPEMIKNTSGEIHVVGAEKAKTTEILGQPQAASKAVNYKTSDMFLHKDNKQTHKSGPAAFNSKILQIDSQNRRLISVHQGRSSPKATTKSKLSHSPSLPLPLPLPSPRKEEKGRADDKGKKTGQESGELDSMVGAVIVTVTLIVMLMCGKACAILCTAVWLYFIPRLQRANAEEILGAMRTKEIVDLDSWEHKNKVVLRGLLERSSSGYQ